MTTNSTTPAAAHAATPKTRRLGRGLASLMTNTRDAIAELPPAEPATQSLPDGRYQPARPQTADAAGRPVELPLDAIRPNPYQPRRQFAEMELDELTASIARQGVLQPLLVARGPAGDGYVLVAGERRLRAARKAGLPSVPCIVRTASREQMIEWALVENVQRQDLNPVELAKAYREYLDRFSATQQQLAEHIGQPRSTVANYLRLLDLGDPVLVLVAEGKLSFGHAKILAGLAGQADLQEQLAREVIAKDLTVRALEERLAAGGSTLSAPVRPPSSSAARSQYIVDVERQMSQAIGTKVQIRPSRSKNRGRIILEYYSLDDFDRIAGALGAKIES